MTSEAMLQSHLQGKQHAKALAAQQASGGSAHATVTRRCEVCATGNMNSGEMLEQHINGAKHKEALAASANAKDNIEEPEQLSSGGSGCTADAAKRGTAKKGPRAKGGKKKIPKESGNTDRGRGEVGQMET